IIITLFSTASFAGTLLTGTLLDYNDNPIKEGFIMSEDDPTFWALTDYDGGFTIQRSSTNEITSITASGAGCVVTNVAITNTHQSGMVIKLAQQDPDFTSIEMGCAIRTSRECASRRIRSRYNRFKDSVHALSAADQLCISNYEAFLASTGEAIITKILNTNALSAAELEYETLMYAEIAARSYSDPAVKNFCKAIIKDAKPVLQKGYKGLPLDSDDIHFLRVYRAMMGIYSPVNNALPGDAGYAYWGPEFKHLIPDVGDTPPEIAVLDWKPLLDSSNHTDTSFLNITESLRFESLYDPLSSFATYDYDDGTGWLVPRDKDALQEYYPFEQGSMRNLRAGAAGKPTMFIFTVFEDRTSPTKRMRFAAYIRGAYGDQVNVVSVCQPSPFYGDMVIDEFNYYGPNTNVNLSHGLRYRWGDEDITPARQARTVKIACMENLNIGGDITLSLNGGPFREIWAPGQYIKMILLDKNGVKSSAYDAALFVESGGGWWEKFTYTYDAPYHPFDNFYNFEQNIRALIDNDGEYDAAISDQGFFPTYPSKQFGIPYKFKVTSIEPGESLVHADWILPTYSTNGIKDKYNYTGTTNANVSFKFAGDTRILLHDTVVYNRDPAEGSTCTTGSITDLEVDGIYYFDFEINETAPPLVKLQDGYDEKWKDRTNRLEAISMKKYFGTTCNVVRVQNYMLRDVKDVGAHSMGTSIPFYGHITQIDGDVITVVMPESDLDDFHGYTFWKEAGADADQLKDYKSEPAVEIQLAAATRWNEGGTAGRTCRFKVDPATRVMVNGHMYKSFADLAVGHYVFIEYQAWQEEQNQSQGILFPETIMASQPLGLSITTMSLTNGQIGVAYNQTLTSTNGVAPFDWSLNSGVLPAGLNLSSDGVISGTPTANGESVFTVKITDNNSDTDTQELSISIVPESVGIVCSVIALCALLR
ncbi:MAG: hypothetical protein DRH79_08585, partial [Candidatus Cloacimonadota bacterium]